MIRLFYFMIVLFVFFILKDIIRKSLRKKMDSKDKKKAEDQNAEKKDWAEMSDDDGENDAGAAEEQKAKPEPEVKKYIPPTQKGTKNKQGDYIVTSFEIPDIRDESKAKKDEEADEDDSSDDDYYGNEDDNDKDQAANTEVTKEGKFKEHYVFVEYHLLNLTIF